MIKNCYELNWDLRGQIVSNCGRDYTGLIEYKFNNQGFRSDFDYIMAPKYAFFGGSIVFGVGVSIDKIFTSYFDQSHNYGLVGSYMNHHSVENFQQFIHSPLHNDNTKIVFVWHDRDEPIEDMIQTVNLCKSNILHISAGQKRVGAINLLPQQDTDVSTTHPGPKTHYAWAKSIKFLLEKT